MDVKFFDRKAYVPLLDSDLVNNLKCLKCAFLWKIIRSKDALIQKQRKELKQLKTYLKK